MMGLPSEKKYDVFSHLDTVREYDGRTTSTALTDA